MTTDKYVSLTIFLQIIQFIPYCIPQKTVLRNIQNGYLHFSQKKQPSNLNLCSTPFFVWSGIRQMMFLQLKHNKLQNHAYCKPFYSYTTIHYALWKQKQIVIQTQFSVWVIIFQVTAAVRFNCVYSHMNE